MVVVQKMKHCHIFLESANVVRVHLHQDTTTDITVCHNLLKTARDCVCYEELNCSEVFYHMACV